MYINKQFDAVRSISEYIDNSKLTDLILQISEKFDEYNRNLTCYTANYKKTMEDAFNQLNVDRFITPNNNGEYNIIDTDGHIDEILEILKSYYAKLCNLKYLEFLSRENQTVVFVGPNGCGKTTLLRKLIEITGENKIGYYQADRTLIVDDTYNPERDYDTFISRSNNSEKEAANINSNSRKYPLVDQFNRTVALFEKNRSRDTEDVSQKRIELDLTLTEKVLKEWHTLVPTRELHCRGDLHVKTLDETDYPIRMLSSGERTIFYFLTSILLNEQKEYYFIDEPENNLNPAIVSRLWDYIESEREGSIFIYLTHDSNFVTSRKNSEVYWIENFDGVEWQYKKLPHDDHIPQDLMIQLVGNRSPIIFCESHDQGKYDALLFRTMFHEYRVFPASGCNAVIKKVEAYKNAGLPDNAYGIVDRDYRNEEDIDRLKERHIYTLPFHEIENFMMCEEVVREIIKSQFHDNSEKQNNIFEELKSNLKRELEENKETRAIRKTYHQIRKTKFNQKEAHLNSYDSFIQEYSKHYSTERVDELYNENIREIEDALKDDDYNKLLRLFDGKTKLFSLWPQELSRIYKDGKSIMNYIINNSELLQKLRCKYFSDISSD